jgi:hypothetical protein
MKIAPRFVKNPAVVASRDEAVAKFAEAIGRVNPTFSPAYVAQRAAAWADAAIAKGAIVIKAVA